MKKIIAFTLLAVFLIVAGILKFTDTNINVKPTAQTEIHLYGEMHGVPEFYDIEFSEWKSFYNKGFRNLFVELPFYYSQYLNEWMKASDNSIIDQLFEDIRNTASGKPEYKNFFCRIKSECPETVFVGTDVGHQYQTTGARYLKKLIDEGKEGTEEYNLTVKNIEQGKTFTEQGSDGGYSTYRESCMVDNFIAAYERIGGGKVMGIYGSLHTNLYDKSLMAGRISEKYPGKISAVILADLIIENKPLSFGFSYIGLIYLIMLFVPNIIWSRFQPKNYEKYAVNENKILLAFERVGQVLVVVAVLIFKDFNPHIFIYEGLIFNADILFLIISFTLMVMYDISWIRYFKSERNMSDFYSSFLGFPLSLATLPVLAFFILGIYGMNPVLIVSSVLLGIGHIGIHIGHKKEAEKEYNEQL